MNLDIQDLAATGDNSAENVDFGNFVLWVYATVFLHNKPNQTKQTEKHCLSHCLTDQIPLIK